MASTDPRHVAEDERDHVARLLAAHDRACHDPWCDERTSLAAHLDRTERQLALLGQPAGTDAMFGP